MNSENPSDSEYTSLNFLNKLPRGLIGRRGLPVARGTRLPSLRGPRDLTLGGAAKRIFTPNIPERKERNKDIDININGNTTKKVRNRRNKSGEYGYGKNRNKGELIQTQGVVFGDGLADISSKSAVNYESTRQECINSNKIYITKSSVKREEKEIERKQLQELLRDDFIDDDEDEGNGEKLYPIVFPIGSNIECFNPNYKKKKQWNRIKIESDDSEDDSFNSNVLKKNNKYNNTSHQKSLEEIQQATAKIFSVDDLSGSGKLLFFQFPDCLPGLIEKEDNTYKNKLESVIDSSSTQKKASHVKKMKGTNTSSNLSNWSEGRLGKLRIHKSGKTCLNIGHLILDLEIGTTVGFLQDLVSVKQKKDGGGDMIVLGHVSEKIVCSPSAESLLAACS